MPIAITDVEFYKSTASSGGVGSLGGTIATPVNQYTVTRSYVISGCTVLRVLRCPSGEGTLEFMPATSSIVWTPPGAQQGYSSIPLTSDRTVVIGEAATGVIVLQVVVSSLPTSYKKDTVTVQGVLHGVFGMVTSAAALLGSTEYRCLYIKNNHPTLTASGLRLYVHTPPMFDQSIAIGVDTAEVGDGFQTGVAQAVASTSIAPENVVFSTPTQAADGLVVGALPPGSARAFWQRRTVPPMSFGQLRTTSAVLGLAFEG